MKRDWRVTLAWQVGLVLAFGALITGAPYGFGAYLFVAFIAVMVIVHRG